MKSELLSLVLLDDHVGKITCPCSFCIRKYVRTSRFFGLWDGFDYGSNWTRTVRVICPCIRKFAIFDLGYTLASANIDQSVPNLATIYMPIRSGMSSITGQIEQEIRSYLPFNLEK